MESNLVFNFANEVHCNIEIAFTYLQANGWDMEGALKSWRQLQDINDTPSTEADKDKEDINEVKKLSRGISRATDNENLVSRARCELVQKFAQDYTPKANWLFIETPTNSFTLPDFSIYSEEFRKFLEKDLIETSTLVTLEQSGRLNWWNESGNAQGPCQRLWPLSTTGDGNCLLHAASLAIWGFHDRLLTLRGAVHSFLESSVHISGLYRRWRWQQTKLNDQSGFVYSEEEWLREWHNIISMSSVEPRKNGNDVNTISGGGANAASSTSIVYAKHTYESLEEVHVLVLAHVLRRPIIIIADTMLRDMNNEPFAPITFGGIYLPIEFSAKDCHRSPLFLAYDMGHFSALVNMESAEKDKCDKSIFILPVIDSDGVLLPIQFSVDPGINYNWYEKHDQTVINGLIPTEKDQLVLLKKYLDIVDLSDNDTVSPDIDSEEEIDKRYIEITDLSDGEYTLFSSKNRAAKQLQSVARQFGSIGKSMSKKLRKNLVSITKVGAKQKKNDGRNRMLCAEVYCKPHPHQYQMIKNYLNFAEKRFLREQKNKITDNECPENVRLQEQALLEGPLKCINANCELMGTVLTSYMCDKCYETQRNEELLKINIDSRFGTGRSKFYRDTDKESYDALKNIPVTKPNMNPDHTLYLSKSTFYYDNDTPYEPEKNSTGKMKPSAQLLKWPVLPTSTTVSNNHVDSRQDNNVNKSNGVHISKFDFGNINQTMNRNFISTDNLTDKENQFSGFDVDFKYEVNKKPPICGSGVISGSSDSLNCREKKKNNITGLKDDCVPPGSGGNKESNGDSTMIYRNVYDVNENRNNKSNYLKKSDLELNPFEFKGVSPSKFKANDSYSNVDIATQRCKSNNCRNLASAKTDYYCGDCHKKRMELV